MPNRMNVGIYVQIVILMDDHPVVEMLAKIATDTAANIAAIATIIIPAP